VQVQLPALFLLGLFMPHGRYAASALGPLALGVGVKNVILFAKIIWYCYKIAISSAKVNDFW
jgi:hypothetical protein